MIWVPGRNRFSPLWKYPKLLQSPKFRLWISRNGRVTCKMGVTLSWRELSKNVLDSSPREVSYREKYVFFALWQISGANRRDNLHEGRARSRTLPSPLFVAISLGVSKWGSQKSYFWTICLRRIVVGLCRKQDLLKRGGGSTEAWRAPLRFSGSCL